jgi:release factor glutamine methyltransferase
MTASGDGGAAPTWRTLVAVAVRAGVESHEARWLGEEASGASSREWAAMLDRECTPLTHRHFTTMVERRLAGEPLQYVIGHWPFRRLDLLVDRRVLVPRPETEWVVETAVRLLQGPPSLRRPSQLGAAGIGNRAPAAPSSKGEPAVVVDLGTGSGAIALAIASECHPNVRVIATDSSLPALAVAGANLAGLGRVGTAVDLRHGDWWDALPADLAGDVDLVVSNPPYVAATDPLPPEVSEWEPVDALVPGPTGLEALETIVGGAPKWLARGGWLVCEIGETQAAAATAMAASAGLTAVEVKQDLAGKDRVLVARR